MTRRLIAAGAAFVASASFASPALATTYYVSPSGTDSAGGTSLTAPWQTVSKVNAAALAPGDTVFFQGGATFTDSALLPSRSGRAGAPVTFGSYGVGQANLPKGIWFADRAWIAFDGLTVDPGGYAAIAGVQASGSGSGSTNVVIRNCRFVNLGIAILVSNAGDAAWTVSGNLIQHTHDSGVITAGHDQTFSNNTILDTGEDASIGYGKHGIYAKGPRLTIVGNTIRRFSANGISARYHDAVIERNTISGGPIGIAWFQNDAAGGQTTIAYNTISGTGASGIYVSPSDNAGATRESFVIANNTIAGSSGNGMDLEATTGNLTVANNVLVGAIDPALAYARPGGTLSEHHNAFWRTNGTANVLANGTWKTVAGYVSTSGQGTGDFAADPLLDDLLTPRTGSPLLDAGTSTVAGATYAAGCDGAIFRFCGKAPDIGAFESSSPAGSSPPVSDTTPPTVSISAPTEGAVPLAFAVAATASDESGIRDVAFLVDGVQRCNAAGAPYACNVRVTRGPHAITVRATDRAGNDATANLAVIASRNAPRQLASRVAATPGSGARVPRRFTARVRATRGTVARVSFALDGTGQCVDAEAPFACRLVASRGRHRIRIRTITHNGNATTVTSLVRVE